MKIDEGYGVHYEANDRQYLDFTSGGIFQSILGNDFRPDPRVDMVSCYGHTNKHTERYKDQLKEFTGFESVALFTTGSEATEAFWRACRVYTGKSGVWGGLVDPDEVGAENTKCDAMHGWTFGALLMAGHATDYSMGISESMGDNRFGLAADMTSCAIMEPYHAPSAQFHKYVTIKRIIGNCKEFPDIPLCVDEIQGGFGRTGKLFAHEWYDGLKPDFVTVGKAMGAGYPLSALLGPKEIMESKAVKDHAHLSSTHAGHPVMCAIGSKVIEQIQRLNLIDRSQHLGVCLKNQLADCGVRHHVGRGLIAGLKFEDADEAHRVYEACLDRGLVVIPTGRKWIKLGPAFIINEEQIEFGVKILKKAIEEVLDARNTKTRRDPGGEPGESKEDVSGSGVSAVGSGDAAGPENDG